MIFIASTNAVNRGYWDPEESTREKWTTTYATELDARNLTHDFTGLSELLLGQAQPAQFQSSDQTGYWWGSKVSDDGNWTVLDNPSGAEESNSNSYIPRSYASGDGKGVHYNFHAASVESILNDRDGSLNSICPYGWKLPTIGTATTDGMRYMLSAEAGITSYGFSDQSAALSSLKKSPISFYASGSYVASTGTYGYVESNTTLFTASRYSANEVWVADTNYNVILTTPYRSTGGYSIRCIKN